MTAATETTESVEADLTEPDATPGDLPRRAFSPREVGYMLGATYKLVLEMIKRGEIGVIRVGREYRIPDVELERLLASAERVTAP